MMVGGNSCTRAAEFAGHNCWMMTRFTTHCLYEEPTPDRVGTRRFR
jgi:hypothetical protein